ncbi:uncharacterized protein [Temnothorax nylanderi]|uniref:uncharacterized protein isoform X1 n=1 Tax=Temnothorax nylanderi TaxID=102681 RepID=UPI003A836C50
MHYLWIPPIKVMSTGYSMFTNYRVFAGWFLNIDRSKWIINASGKSIPSNVLNFLSLGGNFALPINPSEKKDRVCASLDIIKNFEFNTYKIPDKAVDETRRLITNSLHKFLSLNKHMNHIDRYFTKEFIICKKFLRDNDDVLVTKADKGQITVILDKNSYVNQMTGMLNDQTTYKKLMKDPINKITTKINELVKAWHDNGIVSDQMYRRLNCTNGNLPRAYGLPKVHKAGFPLRVIVSTLGSPLYDVASLLQNTLHSSIPKPKSHIKDSWAFAEFINNREINDDEILISLDVTALFTNIPKDLVLRGIEKRWCQISKKTDLTLPQFLHAIDLVLSSTSFVFNGVIYEQIFGSPMGSPLSPDTADIVMDDLETHCLNLLNLNISVFFRYVDDIFAVVPRKHVDLILKVFNDYHPRLKFTYEIENNGSLNFLDTTVIRNGNTLLTNWYRKQTFSGRYTNFYSNHPLKYKLNTITSLVDRAILLSDKRFHSNNIKTVKDILNNNNFPKQIIKKHILKRLHLLKTRDTPHNISTDGKTDFDLRKCMPLPYIKGLSENINYTLSKCHITPLFTIPKKLDCLIKRGKDKIDDLKQTEIVYKITCKDCNAIYIGQTKRHLCTRLKEHQKDIKKPAGKHSVVSEHRISRGHDFDWGNPEIMHRERLMRKRELAEMFFIKKSDNTINMQKDTESLNALYEHIIKET